MLPVLGCSWSHRKQGHSFFDTHFDKFTSTAASVVQTLGVPPWETRSRGVVLCYLFLGHLYKEGKDTVQSVIKQTQMLTFKNKDFLAFLPV